MIYKITSKNQATQKERVYFCSYFGNGSILDSGIKQEKETVFIKQYGVREKWEVLLKIEKILDEKSYNFWNSGYWNVIGFFIWVIGLIFGLSIFSKDNINWFVLLWLFGGLPLFGLLGNGMNNLINSSFYTKLLSKKELQELLDKYKPKNYLDSSIDYDYYEKKEKILTKQERINNAKDEKFNELIDDISEKVKDIEKEDNKIFGSVENKRKAIHAIAKQNLNDNLDWLKEAGYSEKEILKIADDFEIKEQKKLTNHSAYEGRIRSNDKTKIKSALGYNCMACGINMGEKYGKYGENYIELHHKIPYSDMQENDERTLNSDDFCVLCPNCHRIIHKLNDAGDIELLKNIIEINKKL